MELRILLFLVSNGFEFTGGFLATGGFPPRVGFRSKVWVFGPLFISELDFFIAFSEFKIFIIIEI